MYKEWERLYVEEQYSLKKVAEKVGVSASTVKRHLLKMGVKIRARIKKGDKRPPFSQEHVRRMTESAKGRPSFWKGKKLPKHTLYLNMLAHMQWKVELEFLTQFDDVERLKALNKLLTRDRVSTHFDTDKYRQFVEKFYYDEKFIQQVTMYQKSGNKYDRPSLDHIVPLSRGGTWDLDNLQIISWFDNRAKCDMTQDEYEAMKEKYWRQSIQGGNSLALN